MTQVIHVSDTTATLIVVIPLSLGLLVLLTSVARSFTRRDDD